MITKADLLWKECNRWSWEYRGTRTHPSRNPKMLLRLVDGGLTS
jgi:hypothetical protein